MMNSQGFPPVDVKDKKLQDRAQDSNSTGQGRQVIYVRDQYPDVKPRRSAPWRWVIGTMMVLAIMCLVLVVGVWMSGVSHSLGTIGNTVTQNQNTLQQNHSMLSGIQVQLQNISQRLAQLDQDMRSLIASIVHAFHP